MNLTDAMKNVLSIQAQVAAETQDPYHIGLYNGMLMICANHDGTSYEPMWLPSAIKPKTNVEDVRDFHNKFQVPMAEQPSFLDGNAHEFRVKFMQEELNEFADAYEAENLAAAADALVDLAYVVFGTALMMGLPWADLWREVQLANMTKELAKPDGSNSKRGNPLDVVKPDGWQAPDHWPALGLNPSDEVPVFNATLQVLQLGRQRKEQA